jgi:ankyrin repeat protein/mono/diheme cytochrome c family protein
LGAHSGLYGTGEWAEAVNRGEGEREPTLLASGAVSEAKDADGNTALHSAALQGDARRVEELLASGAEPNATNHFGATPLLYAVGNPDSVLALLRAGAEVNRASKFGTTPLIAAALHPRSRTVVQRLLEHGADPRKTTESGYSAMSGAAEAGDLDSFKLLLAARVKPEHVYPPAWIGHREIVEEALKAGAEINFDGGHAGHALNFALYGHQPEIALLLIDRGADLNLRSPRGEHQTPPILWAAYNESGDTSVARRMIAKGADVNMLSARGDSALDWARARGNRALEQVLLQAGAREGSSRNKQKAVPNRSLPSDSNSLNSLIRHSTVQAIQLVQRSSDVFLQSGAVARQKCVSCHQQTLPAVALAWARERGLPVDEISIARQVQDQVRYWRQDEKVPRTYEMIRPQPDAPVLLSYGLVGLSALGYPADSLTKAMVWFLAAIQRPDGSWPAADFRPPMEDGPIQGTAFAVRVLRLYPVAGRELELERRIALARDYLWKARPESFTQQVFQLLGLGWAGETSSRLRPLVHSVLQKQKDDGGWAQLNGLPSDAWATGLALVALNTAGSVGVEDGAFQNGIRFLLRTQFDDGSWYVHSRAWPFQPHFESGFPHGKDQWISAGATAWATMALLLTQPKVKQINRVDWMAVEISDQRKAIPAKAQAPTTLSSVRQEVTFSRDIEPILQRSCAACHGNDRHKGQFSIASREAMVKGGQSGELALQPGNSEASKLVRMVTGQVEDLEMPPLEKRGTYPALSAEEVALLKTWIDQGVPWQPEPHNQQSNDQK